MPSEMPVPLPDRQTKDENNTNTCPEPTSTSNLINPIYPANATVLNTSASIVPSADHSKTGPTTLSSGTSHFSVNNNDIAPIKTDHINTEIFNNKAASTADTPFDTPASQSLGSQESTTVPITTVANGNITTNQTTKLPDPAISQLFPPAALFQACETDDSGCRTGGGGGLFDDWVETPVKPSIDPLLVPNDAIYSGSVSGPSSVLGVPSNNSQPPHSVGAINDLPVVNPHTPQSVPSNYSSYPTTPGGGNTANVISSQLSSGLPSVNVSPSTALKSSRPHSSIQSPAVRLFDNSEPSSDPPLEDRVPVAPHGIAVYLHRSNGILSSMTKDVAEGMQKSSRKSFDADSRDQISSRSSGTHRSAKSSPVKSNPQQQRNSAATSKSRSGSEW